MASKKLYSFGAWAAFAMAFMLVVNGVTTFVPAIWLFWGSRIGIVLSGYGLLPTVWKQVKENEPGWATWLTALAFLGLSVEGMNYIANAGMSTNWLLFGGLAAWAIGMNAIGIRYRLWPLWMSILGIAGGALLFAAVVANTIDPGSIVNLLSAGMGAVILYPAWLVWAGIRLLKAK